MIYLQNTTDEQILQIPKSASQKNASGYVNWGNVIGDIKEQIDLQDEFQTVRDAVAGKYTKPASGIPESDMSDSVNGKLTKAESALQSGDIKTINDESLVGKGNLELYTSAEAKELVANISTQLMEMNRGLEEEIGKKQDAISDLSTIRNGASKGATAVQPSDIAGVATAEYVNASCDNVRAEIPTTVEEILDSKQYITAADASDTYVPQKSITQSTGQSTTSVMSQKAVTELIGNVESILATING